MRMRSFSTILLSLVFFSNLFGQTPKPGLVISHLTGDFYVFTTYSIYKGTRIGANAMYLVTNEGAVLFDSPWDKTQFQPLLDSIWARHQAKVVLCLATHFHEDRTGGLEYYRQQGIKTFTTQRTDGLSKERGMKRAEFLVAKDTVFNVGGYSFKTLYPGPGHAPDNIVVWFEKERILYGGCLIKSAEDRDLGNLSDANVKEYAKSIKKVEQECKYPRFVITGHGDYSNTGSLEHTLKMAEAAAAKAGLPKSIK